jgi:pyruvate/2-oxoglutarate dehydrogenase complex dihydrolipoamide acyltransferase (E2) component
MSEHEKRGGYRIEPIPVMRRFSIDAGRLGRRRHNIHGLIEVDVSRARQLISEHKTRSGEQISFTAWLIFCLSRAVEKNSHMHAYRDWRGRLVIFDEININSLFEVETKGKRFPVPHIFEAVNEKTLHKIHSELRSVQQRPQASGETRFMGWFLRLPGFLRRLFYWAVMRIPTWFRRYSSSVMVTAVGMFGRGGGWGIPLPNFTLMLTVGGIAQKPGVVEGEIAIREYLDLTLSVDHDIVDGAPMARFVHAYRQMLEAGYGLDALDPSL